jgi:glycosyltransferase involved in cell wall biosynthesis
MGEDVLLVGSYPPPFGGCSVHMARLHHALARDRSVSVVDMYGAPRLDDAAGILRLGSPRALRVPRTIAALRRLRSPIVHFHASSMDAFLLIAHPMLSLLGRDSRSIVTIHGGAFVDRFKAGPGWRRGLLRGVLRRFDRVVAVNGEQEQFMAQLGVAPDRMRVIPAFLPPVAEHSGRVQAALASLAHCERTLVTSGSGLAYYGFHVVLEGLRILRRNGRRLGLVICLYHTVDDAYIASLRAEYGDVDFTIVRDFAPPEFAALLAAAGGYVRATDRDGDAVAVREAMYFGVPVFASHCAPRPAGVIVFPTGDASALAGALTAEHAPVPAPAGAGAGFDALVALYREATSA